MPLFFQKNISQESRLGIWQITEAESFFLQKINPVKSINHPLKRVQHLSANYLLTELFPGFPQSSIKISESDKPFLPSCEYFFSVAHTKNFAAALVSTKNVAGIDIEPVSGKPFLLKDKFLQQYEILKIGQGHFIPGNKNIRFTMAWCVKEAIYKWWGKGGISLKNNIEISGMDQETFFCLLHVNNASIALNVHHLAFGNLCLAWVLEDWKH